MTQNYDHEFLLQPVSPGAPAGTSLRYDPLYDRIGEARRQEAALSQGVWQRATHQADWPLVEDLCRNALATRSKDLQIAVWLTEAWLHLYGLPGFVSGCSLIHDLHETYLLDLLPAPTLPDGQATLPLDPTDPAIEHRLNLLQWVNDKLSVQIRLLPLTAPDELSEVAPQSLADMEAARHNHQAARREGTPASKLELDGGFARSLAHTPQDHLHQTWSEIESAVAVVDELGAALDTYYGPANGGLLSIREALGNMALAISPALHQPAAALAPAAPMQTELTPIDLRPLSPPAAGGIQSRDQAYALLGQVAAYLATLEPHSPVPYLIRRAISWGSMSFQELVTEMIKDNATMAEMGNLLRFDGTAKSK